MDKTLILNAIREKENIKTNKDFAKFLEIKPTTLSMWYKRNTFDIELLFKKCEYLNPEWLFTGEGEMLKNSGIQIIKGDRKTSDPIREIQEVPLYDLEATAGLVELMKGGESTHLLDTIKIPNIPTCDGAISVTGDSMYPLLKSGDIILYKEVPVEEQSIFYGEMYLLGVRIDEYEEMITVKYVQKSDRGSEYISLVSQNKYHQPKDVLLKNVTAMAMVKVSIRINTMY